MEETYFINQNNILTINYAYNENGVICYPDLIKVKISLENGAVLGMETLGYLNSHTTRNLSTNKISIEEARALINSDIEITSQREAIIPTEWKTEKHVYEFKGKIDELDFLVYVNVESGKEEDILMILETEGGYLTI
jgi:germination protein YpeB